ncbi:lipid asymmetry maintenance protein MlaB [Nissabacter sp. SGAir0207]|uniref:lipid asymmetry maintenance protein MlaB n=1 Tax=Nissabacter sp. SGAir0207 TaxID=2126321 RepID=UPI0010CD3797|nr:lipid asymmetry maintenance protein MlaB [Nissabacter sp. SGAir0207]QCR37346.1 anti-sigma B factor antagonist [Nissabacter sp. SGAir0207]
MAGSTLNWASRGQTLVLTGDLDRDTLLPLWQQRESLLAQHTALDLSQVGRVDSPGLALLVHLRAEARARGAALTLEGMTDRLETLITLYNLDEIIPVSAAASAR